MDEGTFVVDKHPNKYFVLSPALIKKAISNKAIPLQNM